MFRWLEILYLSWVAALLLVSLVELLVARFLRWRHETPEERDQRRAQEAEKERNRLAKERWLNGELR